MAAVASIASIILFLAFMTAGAQKVVFNPVMSQTAERLGFSKASYRRVGVVELVGALCVLIGLASTGDALATLNEAGAGLLVAVGLFAVLRRVRVGDGWRRFAPELGLAALAGLELALRLSQ